MAKITAVNLENHEFKIDKYPKLNFRVTIAKYSSGDSTLRIGDFAFSVVENDKSEPIYTYHGSDSVKKEKDALKLMGELFEKDMVKTGKYQL